MGTPLSSFSGRLPKWGSMRNGDIWPLQMSVRRTSGSDGSAWPTARTTGLIGGSGSKSMLAKVSDEDDLELLAMAGLSTWSTPQAQMAKNAEPTEWEQENRTRDLHVQVNWGTHTATASQRSSEFVKGRVLTPMEHTKGQLNPDWVEALQGYPQGWTDIAGPPDPDSPNTTGSRPASPPARTTAPTGYAHLGMPSCRRSSIQSPNQFVNGLLRRTWQPKR